MPVGIFGRYDYVLVTSAALPSVGLDTLFVTLP